MSGTDEAEVTQDVTTSEKTEATSESTQKPKDKVKTEAQLLSDKKAEEGRTLKALEERLRLVETENQILKDNRLADAAEKYGLSMEQVKEIGIDNPERLEKTATTFGALRRASQTFTPDSGKTVGGSRYSESQIASMSIADFDKESDEIWKAAAEGKIKQKE